MSRSLLIIFTLAYMSLMGCFSIFITVKALYLWQCLSEASILFFICLLAFVIGLASLGMWAGSYNQISDYVDYFFQEIQIFFWIYSKKGLKIRKKQRKNLKEGWLFAQQEPNKYPSSLDDIVENRIWTQEYKKHKSHRDFKEFI